MRIRDPVWLDMEFTAKEEAIVRTPTFQRLHGIRQLGHVHHVYPGAVHTRFAHSLGVCHVSKVLCGKVGVPPGDQEGIALAALLHDITHTPFAHTLGDQMALLPGWERSAQYKRRFKDIQGELDDISPDVLAPEHKRELASLLDDDGFRSVASGRPTELETPFKAELIGDSFCADLLDYLHRDTLFCGLPMRYDDRILDYASLFTLDGRKHFGLDITRPSRLNGLVRSQMAVTEYMHLLMMRYMLSERVTFYPPKLAADSLLCKAFRLVLAEGDTLGGMPLQDFLYQATDDLLVDALCRHPNRSVSYLAGRLRNRQLPSVALQMDRSLLTESGIQVIGATFRGRSNLAKWLEVENQIAERAGLEPEDIILHCDEPEMNLKGAEVLVQDETGSVRMLNTHEQIPQARQLEEAHRNLWRLYVFEGTGTRQMGLKVHRIAEEVVSDFLADATS